MNLCICFSVSEQGLNPAGWPSHSAQTPPASSAIHIERMKTKEDWVEQHLCDEQAFDALVSFASLKKIYG